MTERSVVLFINILSDNFLRKKQIYVPSLLLFDHGHLLVTNLFSVCSIKQLWMFMFMLLFIFQPDHAVNWVPWSGFLLDSIKSCTFSCNGSIMHGVQSGIILTNDNILKFGQYESITQTSLFGSIARIFSAWYLALFVCMLRIYFLIESVCPFKMGKENIIFCISSWCKSLIP